MEMSNLTLTKTLKPKHVFIYLFLTKSGPVEVIKQPKVAAILGNKTSISNTGRVVIDVRQEILVQKGVLRVESLQVMLKLTVQPKTLNADTAGRKDTGQCNVEPKGRLPM